MKYFCCCVSRAALLCIVLPFAIGCGSSTTETGVETNQPNDHAEAASDDHPDESGTVTLEFVFDSQNTVVAMVDSVQPGDTVYDVMKRVDQPVITMRGTGANAFVVSIGESSTTGGEGWSYTVNGDWADRSVGVYTVQPGDKIRWTFGGFEPDNP